MHVLNNTIEIDTEYEKVKTKMDDLIDFFIFQLLSNGQIPSMDIVGDVIMQFSFKWKIKTVVKNKKNVVIFSFIR